MLARALMYSNGFGSRGVRANSRSDHHPVPTTASGPIPVE